MKPILVTSGEPAGIGPDICLKLADSSIPVVVLGDINLFEERAKILNYNIKFNQFDIKNPQTLKSNHLNIMHIATNDHVIAGKLNSHNAQYVLNQLKTATYLILKKTFDAVVTAPIHKGVINDSGIKFTGHTEFFKDETNAKEVVMMLACQKLRLTTVTTHLPLKDVSKNLNINKIITHVQIVFNALKKYFNCPSPKLIISGLNPHAGESGHLGSEEQEIIIPAVQQLQKNGISITYPCSADTMFSPKNMQQYDAFITMFHDQGLPVIKSLGFGSIVNITLGLPFIRTSVDHGTALELAGTGLASEMSLIAAVKQAHSMIQGTLHS